MSRRQADLRRHTARALSAEQSRIREGMGKGIVRSRARISEPQPLGRARVLTWALLFWVTGHVPVTTATEAAPQLSFEKPRSPIRSRIRSRTRPCALLQFTCYRYLCSGQRHKDVLKLAESASPRGFPPTRPSESGNAKLSYGKRLSMRWRC